MTKNYKIAGIAAILGVAAHITAWTLVFRSGDGLDWKESMMSAEVGTPDIFILLTAGFSAYILISLKHLLNDRHEYHGIDLFIWASVVWHVEHCSSK